MSLLEAPTFEEFSRKLLRQMAESVGIPEHLRHNDMKVEDGMTSQLFREQRQRDLSLRSERRLGWAELDPLIREH